MLDFQYSAYERVGQLKYLARNLTNPNSIYEEINPKNMNKDQEQIEVRECYLSSGAESFVFQFAIQKYKDQDTQDC